jgi:hypothetical protein
MNLQEKEEILGIEDARFRARLVAKRYSQRKDVNFNEIFSHVVKHSSIHVLFVMIALFDLKLQQLDVKNTFLHGELEKPSICINQMGLLLKIKKIMFCRLRR